MDRLTRQLHERPYMVGALQGGGLALAIFLTVLVASAHWTWALCAGIVTMLMAVPAFASAWRRGKGRREQGGDSLR